MPPFHQLVPRQGASEHGRWRTGDRQLLHGEPQPRTPVVSELRGKLIAGRRALGTRARRASGPPELVELGRRASTRIGSVAGLLGACVLGFAVADAGWIALPFATIALMLARSGPPKLALSAFPELAVMCLQAVATTRQRR